MAALTVPTIFTAIDKFTAPLRAMTQASQSFATKTQLAVAQADRAFNKLTPAISGAMREFMSFASVAAVSGAILAGVAFSTKSIMDYEDAVASFRTIVSDATDNEFQAFKAQIADVAKVTNRSTIEVANSFQNIAGLNAEFAKTAEGLGAVSQAAITLAKASGDELGASADSLVGIMNQFGMSALEADRAINVLAAGQAVGAATITQTAESFKNFGSTASGANISLEQSVGLIQTLGKFMINGAEAGTKLRGAVSKLQEANVGYASGQFNINDALVEAKAQIDKLATAQERDAAISKMFGLENKNAGQILLNNIDTYKSFTDAVTGTTEAQKAAAINSNTLSNRLDELSNAWVNMLTSSEQTASSLNTVKSAIGFVTDNLDAIVGVIGTAITVMIAWKSAILLTKGALVVYNAIANAIFLVDMIKYTASTQGLTFAQSALAIAQAELNTIMAANPMGLMVIGIAALIAVVVVAISYWNQFGAALIAVGAIIAAVFSPALALFGLVLSIIMSIYHNWTNIVEAFKGGGIVEGVKMIGKVLLDAVLNPLQQIISLIAKVTGFDWAANAAKSLENFRADMGVNVAQSEPVAAVNPKQAEQDAMVSRMETVSKQNVAIDIKDQTGRAAVSNSGGAVPINLTSTQAWQ
jgi:TP901 family phage tail tape measure protein